MPTTSTSGFVYDASREEGTNNGDDENDDNSRNDEGDIGQQQQSEHILSLFTWEDDFTHHIQDEDHNFRKAISRVRTIGKLNRRR